MAEIKKLQLQGIRSFGPDESDRQNVEFFSPLTLILGQNGCGKTTIIECLKYVTTGDPPPGSNKGTSFVHDPKMAREMMVRGQVKLLFKNTINQERIIARSLEASQKLKNISVKTLDSTISTRLPNGKSTQISSKCADVNAELLLSLGVSKPILNYVIFCHQEDSNWPLEEGKKVKEKFDEIFNSAKYKNCLNHIKDVRKGEMDKAKIDKNSMSHFKSDKEYSDIKVKELKKKRVNLNSMKAHIQSLDQELEPVEEQLKEVSEEEKGFAHVQSKLTAANTKLSCAKNERNQLLKQIVEVFPKTVTQEEIERKKCFVGEESREDEDKKARLEQRIQDNSAAQTTIELKIQKNAGLIGHLVSDKAKFSKDLEDKDSIAKAAFASLDLSEDVEDVTEVLRREAAKVKGQAKRLKLEQDQAEERAGEEVDKLKQERVELMERKRREQVDLVEAKKEIAKIKRLLTELESAGEAVEKIREECNKVESKLAHERTKVDLPVLQAEIEALRSRVGELDAGELRLRDELKSLEEKQTALQQIQCNAEYICRNEEKLRKILNRRNGDFLRLFESVPDAKRVKFVFKEGQERVERELRELEKEQLRRESEIAAKKTSRNQLKKDVERKAKRVDQLEENVAEVLMADEDLDNEVGKVQEELSLARKDLQVREAGKFTYREMLERMERMASPACPTCSRDFAARSEAEELRSDLEKMIADIPRKVKSLQDKVRRLEERQSSLQRISPDVTALKMARKEVEDIRQSMDDLEKAFKVLDDERREKAGSLKVLVEEGENYKDISEDVQSIDSLARELDWLREKKTDLELTCPAIDGGRGLEVVRAEEETVGEQLRIARKQLTTKQDLYNSQSKLVNELEASLNKLTNRKLDIEGKQQERAGIVARREELEKRVAKGQFEIRQCDADLEPLAKRLEEKEEERSHLRKKGEADKEKVQHRERKLEATIVEVVRLEKAIADYREQRKEERFQEEVARKEELEASLRVLREDRSAWEEEIGQIGARLASQKNRLRNCDDNINLRVYEQKMEGYERVVQEQEERLNSMDWKTVERKRKQLQEKKNLISAEKNSKIGESMQMERTVRELERELNSPKLKDAARRYKEKSVHFKTRTMAIEDLNKYYIALDFAIMRFHQEKMKVVNRIIRELWRATYRGNDIDYIEIKTEDADIVSGADKRKNYNYRVVMVKNDTEMDMRGRCSAGQKVLASLIIRLALAETFSASCGIIALDEPTTNLDRENIEGLAIALSDIAEKQANYRSFQLVIITHDEEFIEQLSRCDKIQYYQRVTRNSRGLSEIRKMNVATLEQGGVGE